MSLTRDALKVLPIALTALVLIAVPESAAADLVVTGDTEGNTIFLDAIQPQVNSGGSRSGPRCSWNRLSRGEVINLGGTGASGPAVLTPEQRAEPATYDQNGTIVTAFIVECPGSAPRFVVVDTSTTVADLIPLVRQRIQETLPLPAHDMNPRPEFGSFVNLGLWLAVEDQAIDPITAEAGFAWITARPRLADVSFNLGAGDDPVTCGGLGIPYEEGSNTFDPSPTCGYVYLKKGTFTVTITTTWEIPYDSSNGSDALDPITIDDEFDYQVKEIQTVGTGD